MAAAQIVREPAPDEAGGMPPEPKRSLRKLGVMSLARSILIKKRSPRSRWNMRELQKNRDALADGLSPKPKCRR